MNLNIIKTGIFLICLSMQPCCNNQRNTPDTSLPDNSSTMHPAYNSVYFWKTGYILNSTEKQFLQEFNIRRMYIRFFDVVTADPTLLYEIDAIPIATIRFEELPPQTIEVVPTVYITLEALRYMQGEENIYATKIIKRITAILKAHKIENVSEIQFDCDWTASTKECYFKLCHAARKLLQVHKLQLSSTIRLHQLSQKEPPVDRGILMLYNTGAIKKRETRNSILSYEDVIPYVKNIKYNLPLDFAYPTFTWGVWFRNNTFKAILRNTDFSDTTHFWQQSDSTYLVLKDLVQESHQLVAGDVIRLETSNFKEIIRVKKLVEKKLPQTSYNSIIYHLDSLNLSKYSTDEINSILHTY